VLRRRGKRRAPYTYIPPIRPNASLTLRLRSVKEGDRDDCTRDTVSR
jgi:hypothetical protein